MPDLITQLAESAPNYDLFQAMSLLERSEPERAAIGTSVGLDEAVRLSADVTLSFMPSDVSAVRHSKREGPPLTLFTSVLSLAGAHGPLPVPWTERLLDRRREKDPSGLEFLDIFNQRMLAFLFRNRKKHQWGLNTKGVADAPVTRSLDNLSGLGRAAGARAPGGEQAWLRHAGLQGPAPRSMTTLLALLNDRLKIRLTGRQFVGAWYPLSETDRAVLGRRHGLKGQRLAGGRRLGEETTLGRRAWDQSAGIELEAPALPIAQYLSLLPGGPAHVLLAWLACNHLQSEVEIRLCMAMQMPTGDHLAAQAALKAVMGLGSVQGPRLGLTSWLHGGHRPQGYREVAFAPARFKVRMDPLVERETE